MLKLQVEDTSMRTMFTRLRQNVGPGFVNFWDTFHKYMEFKTDQMFVKLGKKGGGLIGAGSTFRGVTWDPFKSPFVARGGTTKVVKYGAAIGYEMTKKGKYKRVKAIEKQRYVRKMIPVAQASLMQDTMNMRRNAANHIFLKSPTTFTFGSIVPYAAKQDAMRRFLFFDTPTDLNKAQKMAVKFIMGGGQ